MLAPLVQRAVSDGGDATGGCAVAGHSVAQFVTPNHCLPRYVNRKNNRKCDLLDSIRDNHHMSAMLKVSPIIIHSPEKRFVIHLKSETVNSSQEWLLLVLGSWNMFDLGQFELLSDQLHCTVSGKWIISTTDLTPSLTFSSPPYR